jgi:hypothetical protein
MGENVVSSRGPCLSLVLDHVSQTLIVNEAHVDVDLHLHALNT